MRDDSGDAPQAVAADAPLVLIVDVDCATAGLLAEWLAADGCRVAGACGCQRPDDAKRIAIAIVDVPFPRDGGVEHVQRLSRDYPDVPLLALSPTFFASVACTGAVARALGVAGVLPKPVNRDALISAVRRLLRPTPP